MVVAAIALLSIGFAGTAHQANAATDGAVPQHVDHARTASPSIQFGVCSFDPPTPIVWTFWQGGIGSCSTCESIGQLGEDQALWENYYCWFTGAEWQLYIDEGPHRIATNSR
jgi:hypothetical protein